MPVDADLLEILVCPETHQPLGHASPEVLKRVNERVGAGTLRTRGGEPVKKPVQEGLVREDGRILYVVDENIPVMLIEESIEIA